MKKIKVEICKYMARDGKEFDSEEKCLSYEKKIDFLEQISYKKEYAGKWRTAKELFVEDYYEWFDETLDDETDVEQVLNIVIEDALVLRFPYRLKEELLGMKLIRNWEDIFSQENGGDIWLYSDEGFTFKAKETLIQELEEKIAFLNNL